MKLLLNQDPPAGGGGNLPPDWTAGFPEDAKPVIQAKGWKSPVDMFGSYRNLEKVLGDNYPKPDWDDKKYEDFYKRAGRPEKPEEYEWPKDLIEKAPVKIDDNKLKEWSTEFHKQGLSRRQASALAKTYLEREFKEIERHEQERKNEIEQAEMKLRNDWGNKYDENLKLARDAFRRVTPEFDKVLELKGIGNHPDLIKFFHALASKIGEDRSTTPAGGSPSFGAGSPEAAQQEIKQLKDNKEFMASFLKGDKSAVDKWNKLHESAWPKPG